MEANHSSVLLPVESKHGFPFHDELFFPLQLFTAVGTGAFQRKSSRLLVHADIQLALLCYCRGDCIISGKIFLQYFDSIP